jgi:hypothetical protein
MMGFAALNPSYKLDVAMLARDEYLAPASLSEPSPPWRRGRYRLVAGATDMFPWAREGRAGDVAIPTRIDTTRIPELTAPRRRGFVILEFSSFVLPK